jgi:hypothetical protein
MENKSDWRLTSIFIAWALFIFGTSCTVIRPEEFFGLVQRFLGLSEESLLQFRVFWGIVWFTVVKGWHFTEFLILTFLCAKVLKCWYGAQTQNTIALAMLFCIFYAASDEWHQTLVPDRFGSFQDVLIDGLGVSAAGLILFARIKKVVISHV